MSDMAPQRVTLGDVGAAAGVSAAAASLALRGRPGVGESTRQRILEVAAELGYHVRPSKDTPPIVCIGLLLITRRGDPPDVSTGPVVGAITKACADAGGDVRLGTLAVDDDDEPVQIPRLTMQPDVDGFLVIGPWLSKAACGLFGGRPVVAIDGDVEDRDLCSSVVGDDAGGSAAATAALVAAGHRRILLAGAPEDSSATVVERRRGYVEAMERAGLAPAFVDRPPSDPDDVAAAVMAELRRRRFTAVVAVDDAVGLAVMTAAARRGVDVPAALSITGFDDIEATRLVRPRLTTVTVDKPAMGRLGTVMLRHRIERPADPPVTVLQRARLLTRETIAAPGGPAA
jgi:DNA-binding LacI/PurR family transcriptional regulator